MADEQLTTLPDPGLEPSPTSTMPRRRLSRWRIAGLAVAVAVLAGAIGVSVSGANDKSAAEHDRTRAATQLRRQRADTTRTEAELASDRARLETVSRALATPLATANGIGDLITQGADAQHAVQNAGISGSDDDYNVAIERSNAIVDQFNAAVARLDQQIAALSPSSTQRV